MGSARLGSIQSALAGELILIVHITGGITIPHNKDGMQVPWGRKELAIGLFSWAVSFIAVGIVLVPIIGFAAGVQVRFMSHIRT